jgi:mRNA interferase RelE/StbE
VYRIEVSPAAERDLKKLGERIQRPAFERLRDAVRSLADNPRPHKVRKIERTERAYRIRVDAYRLVYEIYDRERLILILHVSRRTEATYRGC